MNKRYKKIKVIQKWLDRCTTWYTYKYGNIPISIYQGACSYAGIIDFEDVLGIIDETVFRNAKEGVLFAEYGWYSSKTKKYILYSDLMEISNWVGYNCTVFNEILKELYNIEIESNIGAIAGEFLNVFLKDFEDYTEKQHIQYEDTDFLEYVSKENDLDIYKCKKKIQDICDESSDISGIVYGNISTASTLYGMDKFRTPKGHGFAAERSNHITDLLKGKKAYLIGDNNEKNGADRIVNGTYIQSKYCKTGSKCISECFENGKFRYITPSGDIMKIEVPLDFYDDAVRALENRIIKGEVPSITNPEDAKNIVCKGSFTYEQAKNIAKFGTVDSIKYDIKNGTIIAIHSTSISASMTFAVSIWNGESFDVSLKKALYSGIRVGGTAYAVTVLSSQLSRTGIEHLFVNSTQKIVEILGPKASTTLINSMRSGTNIYGAAALNSTAKLLRGNIITGIASTIILSSADIVNIFRGKISSKQLFKNVTTTVVSVAGGNAGWTTGATIGATVGSTIPIVGTAVGATVGGILGSFAGSTVSAKAASTVLDSFIEDDAECMLRIIENVFQKMAVDYLLNKNEVENIVNILQYTLNINILRDMFSCKNQNEYAENLLREIVETEVKKRKSIPLIKDTDIIKSLRCLIETL